MQKEVRKAVIAAAGLNSRMYPYTKVESKLMLQIVNKPVVEYLVEELAASGIKEVIIVSNHVSKIKQFFSKNKELNELLKKLQKKTAIDNFKHIEKMCKVELIEQFEPMGWMHEVWNARKFISNEPFLVCFSDILYQSKVPAAKQLIDVFKKTNKNVRAHARFLFKPGVFDVIKKENFELGRDVVDIDVFDNLRANHDLIDIDAEGDFYDVGDPLSYLKTETAFALADKKIGKEYKRYLMSLLK